MSEAEVSQDLSARQPPGAALSLSEAATACSVSRNTIRRRLDAKRFPNAYKDANGRWRTAISDIGIPVGRPQTIPLDLAHLVRSGEHEVRIVTNMRIYWDSVRVGGAVAAGDFKTSTIDPSTAVLRERGAGRAAAVSCDVEVPIRSVRALPRLGGTSAVPGKTEHAPGRETVPVSQPSVSR